MLIPLVHSHPGSDAPANFALRKYLPLRAIWCIISLLVKKERGVKAMRIGFDNEKYLRPAVGADTRAHQTVSAASSIWSLAASSLTTTTPPAFCPASSPTARSRCCWNMKDRGRDSDRHQLPTTSRRNKRRGDLGITYDEDVLQADRRFPRHRPLRGQRASSPSTAGSPPPTHFANRLEALGVRVYMQHWIPSKATRPTSR